LWIIFYLKKRNENSTNNFSLVLGILKL